MSHQAKESVNVSFNDSITKFDYDVGPDEEVVMSRRADLHRDSRLSFASRAYDRGNKGFLDDIEACVRSYDADGDGRLSVDDVHRIASDLRKAEARKRTFKKLAIFSVAIAIVFFACIFGLTWTAVTLTQKLSTGAGDTLVSVQTGNTVKTYSAGSPITVQLEDTLVRRALKRGPERERRMQVDQPMYLGSASRLELMTAYEGIADGRVITVTSQMIANGAVGDLASAALMQSVSDVANAKKGDTGTQPWEMDNNRFLQSVQDGTKLSDNADDSSTPARTGGGGSQGTKTGNDCNAANPNCGSKSATDTTTIDGSLTDTTVSSSSIQDGTKLSDNADDSSTPARTGGGGSQGTKTGNDCNAANPNCGSKSATDTTTTIDGSLTDTTVTSGSIQDGSKLSDNADDSSTPARTGGGGSQGTKTGNDCNAANPNCGSKSATDSSSSPAATTYTSSKTWIIDSSKAVWTEASSGDILISGIRVVNKLDSEFFAYCAAESPDICKIYLTAGYVLDLGDGECFSAMSVVNVEGRGDTFMKDIKVGDRVMVATGSYEEVFAIPHYHHSQPTTFVQLHTGDSEPLELTSRHMVFVHGKTEAVPASSVQVGDILQSINGPQDVKQVSVIVRNGLYNPLTTHGTIVVNNIVASCYATPTGTTELVVGGQKVVSDMHSFLHSFPLQSLCALRSDLCTPETEGMAPVLDFLIRYHRVFTSQDYMTQWIMYAALQLAGLLGFLSSWICSPTVMTLCCGTCVYWRLRDASIASCLKTVMGRRIFRQTAQVA